MLRFLKVRTEHLETILRWRTSPEVTKYLFTDIPYDLEAQKRWHAAISKDENSRHWVIEHQGKPIGLVSLASIDWDNKFATIGFYIGDIEQRELGFLIPPYVFNHAFRTMGLRKILAENMDGNEHIMKFNDMMGFRKIGVYEKHVEKCGRRHDVHLYELTAEAWQGLDKRFGKCVAAFEGSP